MFKLPGDEVKRKVKQEIDFLTGHESFWGWENRSVDQGVQDYGERVFWLFGNGQFLRSDSTLVCLPNSQKFCANGLCGFQNLESHSKLGRLRLCDFMCLVSTDRFCLGNVFFRA